MDGKLTIVCLSIFLLVFSLWAQTAGGFGAKLGTAGLGLGGGGGRGGGREREQEFVRTEEWGGGEGREGERAGVCNQSVGGPLF